MSLLSYFSLRNKIEFWRYANLNGSLILLYHSVAEPRTDPHGLSVSPKNFFSQLSLLKKLFKFVTPDELYLALRKGKVIPKSILVTFDDGYENNFSTAGKILRQLKIPALFFLNTFPILAAERFWWDFVSKPNQIEKVKKTFNPYLTLMTRSNHAAMLPISIEKLRQASSGKYVHFGAHTHYHPSLSSLPREEQTEQILFSKLLLEKWLKRPIHYFAYPFGTLKDFNSVTKEIVRDNFRLGFTTQPFLANSQLYPEQIPRFNVTNQPASKLIHELKIRFPILFSDND